VGGSPPFEEVALTLVEAGDSAALGTYLATKLQVQGRGGGVEGLACVRHAELATHRHEPAPCLYRVEQSR
jgi:hypothetical protein